MTGPKCGTRAGYQRHIRNDESPCDACRVARNAYRAERRKADPEVRRRGNDGQRVIDLATRDVLAAHPDEYRAAIDRRRAEHLARRAVELLNGATS